MNELPFGSEICFEHVKGVGTIDLKLKPNQSVYTFIGENGVGKTKLLESLFSLLILTNDVVNNLNVWIQSDYLPFIFAKINNEKISFDNYSYYLGDGLKFHHFTHKFPLVYISAQQRGNLDEHKDYVNQLGNKEKRLNDYLLYVLDCFNSPSRTLKTLNMDTNLEEWIIQRAQSANPYQSKEDNRQIELTTLTTLLNKLDQRIDATFLEISGDNRVFIKIEDQKRELSELSSGFTSILKILQSIIAGYSYFTNETQIANVRGVVLIDEIESHLHNQWQANIIPLLKELFPNTTFVITTHSSLVISQLQNGEAYRLLRNEKGIVEANLIEEPSKVSFIDLLNEAFGVDLNKLKIQNAQKSGQKEAKKALLALVQQELESLEKE